MNRAEKQARIDADDGDPDDTVYVMRRPTGGTHHHAYHDERTCAQERTAKFESAEVVECRRADAQRRQKYPCLDCTVDPAAVDDATGRTETTDYSGLLADMNADEFDGLVNGDLDVDDVRARIRDREGSAGGSSA